MSAARFTVLLPTTGEKGPFIVHAIECVLGQSERELELLVVGDGMGAGTREVVQSYVARDPRVRLYEFPKQRSRGTPNRHHVLTSDASGEIVCYICDRDLWSRDHLARMGAALESHDLAYTQSLMVERGGMRFGPPLLDLGRDDHRRFFESRIRQFHEFLPLSGVGHTMAMYRRLPHGWRANPVGAETGTDYYMWLQFLGVSECRVGTTLTPTLVWFPKSSWGYQLDAAKAEALRSWRERIMRETWLTERWPLAFQALYPRSAVFRVRAALAEEALGWPEP
jgi:glycosyltransferase involved in cell wall biosynthesis